MLYFAQLQVIHQLKQLATVWQDVLPVSIYCKAMGNLLNTAITEIIAKIMMLEVCRCCDIRDVPCQKKMKELKTSLDIRLSTK